MSIVDWFTNDMNTEERTLTRDLLSVAIADTSSTGNVQLLSGEKGHSQNL